MQLTASSCRRAERRKFAIATHDPQLQTLSPAASMTLTKLFFVSAFIQLEWKCDGVSWKLQQKLRVTPPLSAIFQRR